MLSEVPDIFFERVFGIVEKTAHPIVRRPPPHDTSFPFALPFATLKFSLFIACFISLDVSYKQSACTEFAHLPIRHRVTAVLSIIAPGLATRTTFNPCKFCPNFGYMRVPILFYTLRYG